MGDRAAPGARPRGAGGVPPQNAVRVLAPLIEAGVLTEFTGQKRNRMWQAREVLDALDAFAARAGRRSAG